jgi:hypothetical protein
MPIFSTHCQRSVIQKEKEERKQGDTDSGIRGMQGEGEKRRYLWKI